jgi:hypothetical protein
VNQEGEGEGGGTSLTYLVFFLNNVIRKIHNIKITIEREREERVATKGRKNVLL